MCFSAQASFIGSATLWITGIYTLSLNKQSHSRLFAALPLFFGIQQLSEWLLRLWLSNNIFFTPYTSILTTIFVVFAWVIWPTLVPLSVYLYESRPYNKKILHRLLILWWLVSATFLFSLFVYPYIGSIQWQHLCYTIDWPLRLHYTVSLLYIPAITIPLLSTSTKHTRILGLVLVASLIVSSVFYFHYIISVRCFFAALVSIGIAYIIYRDNRIHHQ